MFTGDLFAIFQSKKANIDSEKQNKHVTKLLRAHSLQGKVNLDSIWLELSFLATRLVKWSAHTELSWQVVCKCTCR